MAQSSQDPVIHRADNLVSREREQAQLAAALERVQSGHAELFTVSGEPGIGKSRLIRDFINEHAETATILQSVCYEDSSSPFSPILTTFRTLVADPPPGWDKAIERSALRNILSQPPMSGETDANISAGNRLADQFAVAIQELATHRPVILALDDAQWASEPELDFIRFVLRSSARTPVLIILSYRDTELTTRHPLQHLIRDAFRESTASRISLSRLDEHGARQLIGTVLDSPAHMITRPLAQAIQQEAEGVPFFIEELVFHLYETGALTKQGRNWTLEKDAEIAIPQSVRSVVGHRLQFLEADTQETLAIAAVIGNEFSLDLVVDVAARVGNADAEAVSDHLRAAMDRSLIVERRAERWGAPDQRYTFAHDQIRDVLYGDLNAIRRRILHQAVGETMEESAYSDELRYDAALTYHFGAGEDIERASHYAERAGDSAAALGAFRQAADHFTTALEIHTLRRTAESENTINRELRLLMKRQQMLGDLDESEAQRRDLARWHELANETDDVAHIFMSTDRMARFAIIHEDSAQAETLSEDLLGLAGDDAELKRQALIRRGEAATGRLTGDPARLYQPAEQLNAARSAFEAALALSDPTHPEAPLLAMELGIIDWELAPEGDRAARAAARERIAEALEQFRERDDDRGEVTALIALAYRRAVNYGEPTTTGTPFVEFLEEIRRLRGEEQRLIRESDRARNEARAALAVHVHCREFGIPQHAVERGIDALNWAEAAGDRRIAFYALGGLSQAEITVGRTENALDFAERAMAIAESGAPNIPRTRANQWLGLASIAAGQRDRGLQLLREAAEIGPDAAATPADLEALTLLAKALAAGTDTAEELSEARSLTERIEQATDGMPGSIPWGVDALLIRSTIDRQSGNLNEALINASAAASRYREREIRLWRLHVEVPYQQARTLIDLGRQDEAIETLTTAAEKLHEASDQITNPDLRTSFFEQVSLHRDIRDLAAEYGVWPGEQPALNNDARPGGLSRRETEVLQLVAIGKTNRDIANQLFISEKTVARHLTNLFTKIGTESRTQAAAWAYRNALA